MATQKIEYPSKPEGKDQSRDQSSWLASFSLALNGLLLACLIQTYLWRSEMPLGTLDQSLNLMKKNSTMTAQSYPCSGSGDLLSEFEGNPATCVCHPCFSGKDCSIPDPTCVIDIKQGDPKIFEKYWFEKGDDGSTTVPGWKSMSYYANSKQFFFVQMELDEAIRSVHRVVGNAITERRHIVIGTGSTQLFQAALYALSSSSPPPKRVVSLAPYYSAYPSLTNYLKSSLYSWGGDAAKFKHEGKNPYIEVVTTPNNPSGEARYPVMNGTGDLIYDFAYYWPHYTPITSPVDEELMLFTLSKSTGHAGSRIGWAIVKDFKLAQMMAKFIELNTLGVSKDAQLRAAQVLRSVAKEYRQEGFVSQRKGSGGEEVPGVDQDNVPPELGLLEPKPFFHFGYSEMEDRWMMLRSALQGSVLFSLPNFQPTFCTFFGKATSPTPAFAWLECLHEDDCEIFLSGHNILARGGVYFGADPRFVRLSMLDRRSGFEVLIQRLKAL